MSSIINLTPCKIDYWRHIFTIQRLNWLKFLLVPLFSYTFKKIIFFLKMFFFSKIILKFFLLKFISYCNLESGSGPGSRSKLDQNSGSGTNFNVFGSTTLASFLYKKMFTFRGQGLQVAPHELGHGMIVLCQATVHLQQTWQALQKRRDAKPTRRFLEVKPSYRSTVY